MEKKQYNYIGRLFLNKDKNDKTYLKGSIKVNDVEVKVIGFLNEIEIKTGEKAGTTAKAFSIAIADDPIKQPVVDKKPGKLKPNKDENPDF